MSKKAILVSLSPGYNLGLAKLKNWLSEQSAAWQVEIAREALPLVDNADLYAFSAIWSWDLPRLIEQVQRVPRDREIWIGGPGVTLLAQWVERQTGIRPVVGPDARFERQPGAYAWTRTTRGCPVGCAFCIVSRMDGASIVEYDDFPPTPVIVDDNLLRSSWEHQARVVERLAAQNYAWVDVNSGFDPTLFSVEHYDLYARLPLKAWRLAFDEEKEAEAVARMIALLRARGVSQNKIWVYVLVGFTDTPAESLSRAQRVIEWGAEPRIQPYRPLTWLRRDQPFVNAAQGWSEEIAFALPRYFYGYYWRRMGFDEFLVYTRVRPNARRGLPQSAYPRCPVQAKGSASR